MKDDRLYLVHMRECLDRIERYTMGGREAFDANTMIQDAVMRNLQTLAESTQRLSDLTRARRPDLDWRGMAAFRNVIVHNYLGIDLDQIWDIVTRDLPVLRDNLHDVLPEGE